LKFSSESDIELKKLASPIIPEFFVVLGINVFLVTSLLTCLLDFPLVSQYIYQLAALAGFGQLWVNIALSSSIETRFWFNVFYLVVALVNVITVNIYVAMVKKRLSLAGLFLGGVTIPASFTSLITVSSYVNSIPLSVPLLPVIPIEAVGVVLIICGVILATSVVTSFKPEALSAFYLSNKKREVKKWAKRKQRTNAAKENM
jgi:hypothetical protein